MVGAKGVELLGFGVGGRGRDDAGAGCLSELGGRGELWVA